MKRLGVVSLLVTCVLASAGAGSAAAAEADFLFEPDHVTEIDLDLPLASREALAATPDEYVMGTFSLTRDDGATYGPLVTGVRLKGHGSFRTLEDKAAFKLKFNEFVPGQKFLGLKKLTLNNMVQDRTMVHELLAYEAFRAMGLAAPRTGYSFVRVNGEDYGVYLNIETLDSVSLPQWHATTKHLYEGELRVDLVPGGVPLYELEEGDEDDLTDLEALIAAVGSWDDVDTVADLDQLTRFWAVERYIGHWDGYSGSRPNNYYLHSDENGRFTMLPWGTDQTWAARLAYGDPGGLMFDQCIADAACEALYRDAVDDVRATLGPLDLDVLASDTAALLYPWQRIDPRRESTLQEMRLGLVELYDFLAARPLDDAWLSPVPPVPPVPPPVTGDAEGDDAAPPGVTRSVQPDVAVLPRDLAIRSLGLRRRWLTTSLDVPGPGSVAMRASARIRGKQRRVCRSDRSVRAAGTPTARCKLSRAARRRLQSGTLRIALLVRFVPSTGATRSIVRRVTLSR